jgi:hypothetical protein
MKRGSNDEEEELRMIERVKRQKGGQIGISFPHVCERSFCNPECERGGYVYVCDYGAVHVCLSDRCDLAILTERGEWVCPLSGLVLGVDDEEPTVKRSDEDGRLIPLGWKLIKEKPKQTAPKVTIAQHARFVVETLFFGNARGAINAEFMQRQKSTYTQLTQRYLQEQQRRSRFIFLHELHRIAANTVMQRQPYRILTQDAESEQHVKNCVHVIEQVWTKLILPVYELGKHVSVPDAHNKPHMDQCIYGVLALMNVGHELVQFDEWVWENLPPEGDMERFKLSHVKFKVAKMIVSRLYDISKRLGMGVFIEPLSLPPPPEGGGEKVNLPRLTARGTFCKTCGVRYMDTTSHRCKEEEEEDLLKPF